MTDLQITPASAGIAITTMAFMYAIFQYPGGRLADGLTRKTVLVLGTGLVVCGFLLVSIAVVLPLLLFGAAVIGAGGGLYYISMRATTADLYTRRRAQSFGIQGAIGRVGSASAAGVAVVVLAVTSWRVAFVPLAIALAIAGVVIHRKSNEGYEFGRVDVGLAGTAQRLFKSLVIRRVLVAYVLVMFVLQGVLGFIPTYLQFERAFSPFLANAGYAAIYVIGVAVAPLSGYLADRYQKLPIAGAGMVLAIVGLIGLVSVASPILVGVSVLLFGFGMFAFPPATQAFLVDVFDDENFAGDLGASKTVYGGLGSFGPAYVGVVAGVWNYTIAYVGLILVLAMAILVFAVALLDEPAQS
jgi:MFS family permease